ncbi:hypothetical protein EVAR_82179_1 [Eumeta japonica]|uniref:Uncharacterized protein n=1 Tax=Eumeta variegata TaxID=151549 RepID=A0A4C2AG91_EUMVA|nr:hypothetical protein EVAR_82179_1 [Eumeta japonica]
MERDGNKTVSTGNSTGGTKEEAVRRLMAEMSSSEEDASRRKSRDSDFLVKKILEDEKRALAAGSSGESSMSSVDTHPRKTARKKTVSVEVHTPKELRTPAETESGAFVSLQAVGEFAGRLSLCEEIERPPMPEPETAAKKAQDLAHTPIKDDRPSETEPSISKTASIEAVISKLCAIGELALRLEESRSSYAAGLEREKASKAREIASLESQHRQKTERQLKQCLDLAAKMDIVEKEVKATRNILGFYDVPETLERIRKAVEQPQKRTYSQVAATTPSAPAKKTPLPQRGSAHTIIVTSKETADTADHVIEKIRRAVDARKMKVCVDRLRKTKDQKVVISCPTRKDIDRMSGQLKEKGLKVTEATRKLPMVVIRDVLRENTDEDIVKSLKKQNKHATADLDWGSIEIRVRFRKRARNDHECHPVLEVSRLWRRLVDAGYVMWGYKDAQSQICEKRQKGEAPKCINCTRDKLNDTAHGAFSSECSVRNKWDAIARARVSYTLPADAAPTRKTDGRPRLPGVESGDSQDDIRRRDRADSHVRFVRLGPATKKLGVRKMLDALQRSVALKACRATELPPFRADPREVAPLDIRVRSSKLYEVKRGSESGTSVLTGSSRSPWTSANAASAHSELGFESVEDLDPSTVDRLAIVGPHIYTDGSKTEGK